MSAFNGPAAGLALAMALYSDFRLASGKAAFTTNFVRRGSLPSMKWCGCPSIVGHANAMDLLLSSRKMDAREARAMGFVMRRHPMAPDPTTAATALKAITHKVVRSIAPESRPSWLSAPGRDRQFEAPAES